tara:strand:+ start:412 stop:705 length:294 start_codon:yes stop_codon:yes gene_type:complete
MKDEQTTTASIAIADRPLGKPKKRKYKQFDVSNETFNRFATGRTKFERWSKYLNLEDRNEKSIYDYHRSSHGESVIILRNEENGALRAIRPRSSNGL